MADMTTFFQGMNWKRLAIIGVSGGAMIGVSDYWVDQWWEDETDEKTRGRYRAAAQIGLGVGLGYVIRRWNKDVALGVAVGGVVGGVRRLWISEEMPEKMDEWFGDEDSSTGSTSSTGAVHYLDAGREGRVVFTGPRYARAAV